MTMLNNAIAQEFNALDMVVDALHLGRVTRGIKYNNIHETNLEHFHI